MNDPAPAQTPNPQFGTPQSPSGAFPIPPPEATKPNPQPIPSNPVEAGAGSAGGVPLPTDPAIDHMKVLVDAFEAQLSEQFTALMSSAHSKISEVVSRFETYLAQGQTEIDLIVSELKRGGVTGRLHAVEMALASLAGPSIMPAGHDGHGLLQSWFAGIKDVFDRVVADVAGKAAPAAGVPPGDTVAPPPVPVSPAAAQIAALGIPQFQPPRRDAETPVR